MSLASITFCRVSKQTNHRPLEHLKEYFQDVPMLHNSFGNFDANEFASKKIFLVTAKFG